MTNTPTKGRLIMIKQGLRSELKPDSLKVGELCLLTDENVAIIGTDSGNVEFVMQHKLPSMTVQDGSITYDKLDEDMKKMIDDLVLAATVPLASSTNDGLLSSNLFTKLASIESNATKTEIVNNLTSMSITGALSAYQGKVLDDKIKLLESNNGTLAVVDDLTSTSSTDALSANMGRKLQDEKADKTTATTSTSGLMTPAMVSKLNSVSAGATSVTIENNLTSTSTTNAVSVNQARLLSGRVDTHISKLATLTEHGHVYHGVANAIISTNWTGTEAPYTQEVVVNGILPDDTPFITVNYSTDIVIALLEKTAYSSIDNATTSLNKITFKCFEEKPVTPLNIQIKVIR